MSIKGQIQLNCGLPTVETFAHEFTHGESIPSHTHEVDQLLYAASGAMTVTTGDGTWVIPPERGVWIPAGTSHQIVMSGSVRMRSLYLKAGYAFEDVDRCRVLAIEPLDRELILALASGQQPSHTDYWELVVRLLLARVALLAVEPLHLPMPRDTRALRVANEILDAPERNDDLQDLARASGASLRTLTRLFARETGLTLGRFRQQARLLASLRLLAQGHPVTSVALDVGYASPSAFVAMFRRVMGVSPGRYYDTSEDRD